MTHCDDFYHYLPVSDMTMQWGIYVTGVGYAVIPSGQDYPPEGHPRLYDFRWQRGRVLPEFQVIYISDGRGVFESEPTGKVCIEPNSLVFLFSGEWHTYRPDRSTGWTERWISFNGELAHRLLDLQAFRTESAVRQVKNPKTLSKAFDKLLNRIHEDPNQNSILVSQQAMSLIGTSLVSKQAMSLIETNLEDIIKKGKPLPSGQNNVRRKNISDPLAADALDLIWTHSHHVMSVGQIAAQLAVSRRTLERHFQRELQHTVLEEINTCRLSRAKRLLHETGLGVKAVASLAGFSSDERMRVAFVQSEDISPSEYRKETIIRRNG